MPKHTYDHLVAAALEHPWALTRPMLGIVASILARRLSGAQAASDMTYVKGPTSPTSTVTGTVAVIGLHGVLCPRMNLMSDISGGATYEEATMQLREAVANPAVTSILLDWDSPGGSVAGATELAAEVLRARAVKPIISQANFQMCSAAYWVGACATKIHASPSAMIGSIGVYSIHEDLSEALKLAGVKLTYISAGKFKVDGNEAEPLSDTARATLKAHVDAAYARFIGDVAKGRVATDALIRSGYGEGTVVGADEALALGMIDRIATVDETLTSMLTAHTPTALTPAATAHPVPPVADTSQEPAKATDQDRRRRDRMTRERAFHEMAF
jgi:signal peptide peptidase SppA